MLPFERVVVLSPHTDDAELCCGGTLTRFIEQGACVTVVAFSDCRESIPQGAPVDLLAREFAASMASLRVERPVLLEYPVRRFGEMRQDILEDLVRLRRELAPELVLIPSAGDVHQDHSVIHAEALRAFRATSILAYEAPWNDTDFSPQGFVALTEAHLCAKLSALACYGSQLQLERAYFSEEFLRGWARFRGVQAGCQLAEAFEIVRARF